MWSGIGVFIPKCAHLSNFRDKIKFQLLLCVFVASSVIKPSYFIMNVWAIRIKDIMGKVLITKSQDLVEK